MKLIPRAPTIVTRHSVQGHARQRLTLQVAFVGFLAVIHFFLIASFLNGSMHSTAVIKITYTREAVRSAAQETSNILLQAIADVNRLRRAGNFAHNTEAEKQLRAFFEAEASKDSGVDPTLVCKAAAEKAYNEHQQPR